MLCSLSVLHSPEHTDSQSWVEKRRVREEIEVTWGRKRIVKRGERIIKLVITLLSKNGY